MPRLSRAQPELVFAVKVIERFPINYFSVIFLTLVGTVDKSVDRCRDTVTTTV
jgi:hypothetical protein